MYQNCPRLKGEPLPQKLPEEKAEYKGYIARKYGVSSLSVKKDGHTVFHTGFRNEEACKDLHAWLVEHVDVFIPMIERERWR